MILLLQMSLYGCFLMPSQDNEILVSGEEFRTLYHQKRTQARHLDYVGVHDGFHRLDIYDIEYESLARFRGTYITSVKNLPVEFPLASQPEIEKTMPDGHIRR